MFNFEERILAYTKNVRALGALNRINIKQFIKNTLWNKSVTTWNNILDQLAVLYCTIEYKTYNIIIYEILKAWNRKLKFINVYNPINTINKLHIRGSIILSQQIKQIFEDIEIYDKANIVRLYHEGHIVFDNYDFDWIRPYAFVIIRDKFEHYLDYYYAPEITSTHTSPIVFFIK